MNNPTPWSAIVGLFVLIWGAVLTLAGAILLIRFVLTVTL